MRHRLARLILLSGGVAALVPASAQTSLEVPVYRREVFNYAGGSRPDPFRSLLNAQELGYRFEDMSLTGVIYTPDRQRAVAVLTENVSKKRFRLRTGERLGEITIAAIHPRRVDVIINEFGVIRRETLEIKRPEPAREGAGARPPQLPTTQAPPQTPPPAPAFPTGAQKGR